MSGAEEVAASSRAGSSPSTSAAEEEEPIASAAGSFAATPVADGSPEVVLPVEEEAAPPTAAWEATAASAAKARLVAVIPSPVGEIYCEVRIEELEGEFAIVRLPVFAKKIAGARLVKVLAAELQALPAVWPANALRLSDEDLEAASGEVVGAFGIRAPSAASPVESSTATHHGPFGIGAGITPTWAQPGPPTTRPYDLGGFATLYPAKNFPPEPPRRRQSRVAFGAESGWESGSASEDEEEKDELGMLRPEPRRSQRPQPDPANQKAAAFAKAVRALQAGGIEPREAWEFLTSGHAAAAGLTTTPTPSVPPRASAAGSNRPLGATPMGASPWTAGPPWDHPEAASAALGPFAAQWAATPAPVPQWGAPPFVSRPVAGPGYAPPLGPDFGAAADAGGRALLQSLWTPGTSSAPASSDALLQQLSAGQPVNPQLIQIEMPRAIQAMSRKKGDSDSDRDDAQEETAGGSLGRREGFQKASRNSPPPSPLCKPPGRHGEGVHSASPRACGRHFGIPGVPHEGVRRHVEAAVHQARRPLPSTLRADERVEPSVLGRKRRRCASHDSAASQGCPPGGVGLGGVEHGEAAPALRGPPRAIGMGGHVRGAGGRELLPRGIGVAAPQHPGSLCDAGSGRRGRHREREGRRCEGEEPAEEEEGHARGGWDRRGEKVKKRRAAGTARGEPMRGGDLKRATHRAKRAPLGGAARRRVRNDRVLRGLREPRQGEMDLVALTLMNEVRAADDASRRARIASVGGRHEEGDEAVSVPVQVVEEPDDESWEDWSHSAEGPVPDPPVQLVSDDDMEEVTVEEEVDSPTSAVLPPPAAAGVRPTPKWAARAMLAVAYRGELEAEESAAAKEEERSERVAAAATADDASLCEGASFDARAAGPPTRKEHASKTHKHMFPSHAWPILTQSSPTRPRPSLPRGAMSFVHRLREEGGVARGGGKVGSRISAQVPWSKETKHIHRVWIEGLQLPEGSVGDRVLRARLAHRRGPIGRVLSWLRRARQLGQDVTSGPSGRFRAGDEDGGGDFTTPGRRPGHGLSLLPCHLPPRPEPLQPALGGGGRSRVRDSRFRARCVAWDLLEWQIAIFNFFELGGPKSPAALKESLGPWAHTALQLASCEAMLRENLALCRPLAGIVTPVSGRGLATLRSELTRFEEAWAPPPSPQSNASRKPPRSTPYP